MLNADIQCLDYISFHRCCRSTQLSTCQLDHVALFPPTLSIAVPETPFDREFTGRRVIHVSKAVILFLISLDSYSVDNTNLSIKVGRIV